MAKQFRPDAGTHIDSACVAAVGMANVSGESVEMIFNGVDLVVRPGERPEDVSDRWSKGMAEASAAWRASPEGIAQQQLANAIAETAKRNTARLLEELPAIVNDGPALMRWLLKFTDAADHVAAKFDTAALAKRLEAAGYRDNHHVGRPESDFNDEQTLREYVVGQVIRCLHSGMPPHPVTKKFIGQYANLPSVLAAT